MIHEEPDQFHLLVHGCVIKNKNKCKTNGKKKRRQMYGFFCSSCLRDLFLHGLTFSASYLSLALFLY